MSTTVKGSDKQKTSRRRFLKTTVAASAAATVAAPSVVKAQGPITMRWQSTWPSKDIFHEFALDYAKKVNDMTGGDLKIEVLPAGAVVPAFGLLEAVSKGTLDGGHGVMVYHYGKQTALALWGSGPAYAMDANMLLAWHKYGGGKELLDKLYTSIGANVVSIPYGPMPTQPLGWFKKPIAKAEDLKGTKFRTVGISIDVFTGLGAAVNALPGGEIVSAMDRGLLDAAEFNNASSDRILGFPDVSKVCMLQSYHQNAEQFETAVQQDQVRCLCQQTCERSSTLLQMRLVRTWPGRRLIAIPRTTPRCRAKTRSSSTRPLTQSFRSNSTSTIRSSRRSLPKIRCSRKSLTRKWHSPSVRPNGSRTPSSIGAWPTTITSVRTPRSGPNAPM